MQDSGDTSCFGAQFPGGRLDGAKVGNTWRIEAPGVLSVSTFLSFNRATELSVLAKPGQQVGLQPSCDGRRGIVLTEAMLPAPMILSQVL